MDVKQLIAFLLPLQLRVELVLLGFSAYLFFAPCVTENSTYSNIVIGVFSSVLLVVVFHLYHLIDEFNKYKYLSGRFLRIRFYNKIISTSENSYVEIHNYFKSVDKYIYFKYKGNGSYDGIIEYAEGKVQFELSLNSAVPSVGTGTYNYITKRHITRVQDGTTFYDHSTRPLQELDFGEYSITKYRLNVDYVILYHKNIAPSAKTEGYELLVKSKVVDSSIVVIKRAIRTGRQLKIKLTNSHDYTDDMQYMIFEPYEIAIEIATGDTIVYGNVKKSRSGHVGFVAVSIPFVSGVEITSTIFDRQSYVLNPEKYKAL